MAVVKLEAPSQQVSEIGVLGNEPAESEAIAGSKEQQLDIFDSDQQPMKSSINDNRENVWQDERNDYEMGNDYGHPTMQVESLGTGIKEDG